MVWDISDRFPSWGEAGETPGDGFFYEGGDQVNEKHLDFLWNSVNGLEEDVIAALNDIDTDGDGKVNSADTADSASTYKGNDIDTDGDGVVDKADSASTYKGNDIDTDGDGKVNSADTADSASTYKGNDIDTDGDGVVDKADNSAALQGDTQGSGNGLDADTVDGQHASDISGSLNMKGMTGVGEQWVDVPDGIQPAGIVMVSESSSYGDPETEIEFSDGTTTIISGGNGSTKNLGYAEIYADIDWTKTITRIRVYDSNSSYSLSEWTIVWLENN